MKYIVYMYNPPYLLNLGGYVRNELKNDKELKDFLFKHQDNLKNIEVFNKVNKCKINFEIYIKEGK